MSYMKLNETVNQRSSDNTMGIWKKRKRRAMVDNILQWKLKIEQHESHYKTVVNSGASEE